MSPVSLAYMLTVSKLRALSCKIVKSVNRPTNSSSDPSVSRSNIFKRSTKSALGSAEYSSTRTIRGVVLSDKVSAG